MGIIKRLMSKLKTRAMSAGDIEWELYQRHISLGIAGSYPTLYVGNEGSYLVYVDRGKLYKVIANSEEGKVTFSEPQEIVVEHIPVSRSNLFVERTDEGLKIAGIAGSATINRSHEIDTKSLFDSLIENFYEDEIYRINFYHERERLDHQMGQVFHLERNGNLLLFYGTIDEETILGRYAAKNFSDSSEDDWGLSIEFYPTEYETLNFDGVEVRSYIKGEFGGLAVVLESDASHFFTKIIGDQE